MAETIDLKDADQHRETVDALDSVNPEIACQCGVLDAQFMAEEEQTWAD